jgi:hypothetical protein
VAAALLDAGANIETTTIVVVYATSLGNYLWVRFDDTLLLKRNNVNAIDLSGRTTFFAESAAAACILPKQR